MKIFIVEWKFHSTYSQILIVLCCPSSTSRLSSSLSTKYITLSGKPIWAILDYEIYEKLKSSGYIDDVIRSINHDKVEYLTGVERSLWEWHDDIHDDLFV